MDAYAYGKPKSDNFKKRSRDQFDNGKRKRQNPYPSHDPSSGPPKVIETVYRILCPIKKIGSVLGKGGEIVRALRDETHAKIRVADAIPGAEERVVIIFNYPSKQSGEVDGDQGTENNDVVGDKFDDMHPHCPAQNALLKVHDRIAADEYVRGGVVHEKTNPDDTVTARVLVPSNQVGCLLGKGGTVIKQLRSEYASANIHVLSHKHLPPCAMSTDELVQISGPPTIVKKALYDVSTRLHKHPRKDNPPIDDLIYASTQGLYQPGASLPPPPHGNPMWSSPPPPWHGEYRNEPYRNEPYRNEPFRNEPSGFPPSGYTSGHSDNFGEAPEEFSIRLLCPAGRIGGVIGKAGSNVRQVEHETQARIQVEDTSPEAEERIISVSSREGPWDRISPTIEAILLLQSRTCAASEDGKITTRLLVPSTKVGCLLGQGGKIISEMRRQTRADIRVYSKEDKPKYTSADEELVQISGSPDVARDAFLEVASRLRMRTFRSGNSTVNPSPTVPNHGFVPSERMPGRGPPPSHMFGQAGSPPPVYPARGFAPERISSRPLSSSSMFRGSNPVSYEYPEYPKGSGSAYEAPPVYPPGPPPAASGYSSMPTSMEIKIPNSAVSSVLGVGGSNISEIRQISGARVKLHDPLPGSSECIVEIHGSSEQLKAAQSLLQAFVASGGQSSAQPPTQPPLYPRY
ncbi:uncharacterized protein A4U43_C06F15860 [Asparagus officinalis]|uniref:K Homology domain-containing protein n=1 Tax=Asparagus officinalis TaxID=4686 RepID=A0A5P1EMT4_ASPOF|nr:KH domain-containing protein HEN4-like [Asparagus officinalis]ONK67114.1 uncharacterized protein A4U43_C06F15860 [Asparagus officinalis]